MAELWGVVNNAGLNFLGDAELTTMEQYSRVMDVNLLGYIRVTKTFLPLMRKNKGTIKHFMFQEIRFILDPNA